MDSPKCATIRDTLALLTKSLNLSPLSQAGKIFKTLTKLMWGHFNWKNPSNFILLMVHSERLPLAIIHSPHNQVKLANLYFLSPIFSDLMSAIISDVEIVLQLFSNMKRFLYTLIDDATIFWGKRSEFLSCLSFLQDTFLYCLRDITNSSKYSAGFF